MSCECGKGANLQDVYDDLVGIQEIAERLGVSQHRVKRWIERRASTECPAPLVSLKGMHVYSMVEWHGWYALWKVTRGSETWRRKIDIHAREWEEE